MMFSSDDHEIENADDMATRSNSSQRSDPEDYKKSILNGVIIYFGKSVESQQGIRQSLLLRFPVSLFLFYRLNSFREAKNDCNGIRS